MEKLREQLISLAEAHAHRAHGLGDEGELYCYLQGKAAAFRIAAELTEHDWEI